MSAKENEYKLEKSQSQIENPDYAENKIKIDKMKENTIRELVKITDTDMNERHL